MKHILLTSNGFNTTTQSLEINNLFKQIAKNKKILLITNATKEGSNIQAKKVVKENFEKVGASIVDKIEIDAKNVKTIFDYDIIYGMGGSLRILIDDIWESHFKEYLEEFLQTGTYIGESAGSMVLCDNLEWVWKLKKGYKPKYAILPKSFEGLNLVKERIFPHWNQISEQLREKTEQYEKEYPIKITKLNDGEFLWG